MSGLHQKTLLRAVLHYLPRGRSPPLAAVVPILRNYGDLPYGRNLLVTDDYHAKS